MFIAQRIARVRGQAGVAWAAEITQAIQADGGAVSLWLGGAGTPVGTIGWSMLANSYAELVEAQAAHANGAGYQRLIGAGVDHVDSVDVDRLMVVVHGEMPAPSAVGTIIGSVRGIVNPERAADAEAFAPQIADAWTAATGRPVVVARNAAGDMGEMTWLTRFDSPAEVDDALVKTYGSADYAEALAAGNGLFTSGVQAYAQRIV